VADYAISRRATGWYFREILHEADDLPAPQTELETPSRDELIQFIEGGLEDLAAEANGAEPSPLTAPMDVVHR
jgi:hypothetical protein